MNDFVAPGRVTLWKEEGEENIGNLMWTAVSRQELGRFCETGSWDIDFMAILAPIQNLFANVSAMSFIRTSQCQILQNCILRPLRLSNSRQGLVFAKFGTCSEMLSKFR
jgi:hypothetical protein